jgi:2-oxoglutarate dehydrogenase E2 component (dihydrolipoamide succinyltransferase)
MAIIDIRVPDLGDGVTKTTVACWHHSVGDYINADEDVVELVTEKASFYVPAPQSGTLKEIVASAGQEVEIGGLLGKIQK